MRNKTEFKSLDEIVEYCMTGPISTLRGRFKGELWKFMSDKAVVLLEDINKDPTKGADFFVTRFLESVFLNYDKQKSLIMDCSSCGLPVIGSSICAVCTEKHLNIVMTDLKKDEE